MTAPQRCLAPVRSRREDRGSIILALARDRSARRRSGEILQCKRDKRAAKRLLIKLMKRWGCGPKQIITDKLRPYGAAKREVAPGLGHRFHKDLNNRAGNSHLPFRKRERMMQGFRSQGGFQRFVSIHSATRNCFSIPGRRRCALTIRYHRLGALQTWKAVAKLA